MKHQFIKIIEIDKARYKGDGVRSDRMYGVTVICPECGDVRKAWEDGVIEVIIESKTPCKKNKTSQ